MTIIFTLLSISLIVYIVVIIKGYLKEVNAFEYKTPHIAISILLILLFISAASTLGDNQDKINELKNDTNTLEENNKVLISKNETLEGKVRIANDYLELDVDEKKLVDEKIKEIKAATEEEKKKALNEQAEKEKAEQQAAEKKKADEEAAKKAQEEAAQKADRKSVV